MSTEPAEDGNQRRNVPWLALVGMAVIGLTTLLLWLWGEPLLTFFRDQERVRQWLHEFGPLAPLSSVALNAAQVVVAPVPGQVIGLANGYLFGVLWGTFYSVIGLTLGSALAMGLGRWLGRPIVERFVPPEELARWDHLAQRRGPIFFLLVFLLPLVPDDVACFAVGFSPLSIPYILAIAIVGRLPGLIFTSWLGANASALSPVGLTLIIFGAVILAGFVLRYRSQIEARLVRLAERWSERF